MDIKLKGNLPILCIDDTDFVYSLKESIYIYEKRKAS